MAWGSGSAARSCPEWSELFWETKSGGRQLCYFLGCDISPPSGGRVLPLPKVQEPAATSLPESEVAARTAGATGMAQPHRSTFAACSAKGLFVYQRLGCCPPLLRFTQWAAGRGPFLSMAASPLWLFSGIWGQRLYFTPSVGPVDSSEGEFYCSAAGHDAKGRCHEGGAGQWGTREGTWITRLKIPSKHHLKIFPSHGQKRVKPSFEM